MSEFNEGRNFSYRNNAEVIWAHEPATERAYFEVTQQLTDYARQAVAATSYMAEPKLAVFLNHSQPAPFTMDGVDKIEVRGLFHSETDELTVQQPDHTIIFADFYKDGEPIVFDEDERWFTNEQSGPGEYVIFLYPDDQPLVVLADTLFTVERYYSEAGRVSYPDCVNVLRNQGYEFRTLSDEDCAALIDIVGSQSVNLIGTLNQWD